MADFTDEPWAPTDDTRDSDEPTTTSAREEDDPLEEALRDDDPAAQTQPGGGEHTFPAPTRHFSGDAPRGAD